MQQYLLGQRPLGTKVDGSQYFVCPFCNGRRKLEVDFRKGLYYCHKCNESGKVQKDQKVRVGMTNKLTRRYYRPCGKIPEYLYQRGIPEELCIELQPHNGPDSRRVYFPCYNLGGSDEPMYMVGRATRDHVVPRYIYPRNGEFPNRKRDSFWGLHRFDRERNFKRLVLCEGIFDAIWCKERIALLGSIISPEQVRTVNSIHVDEIIVLLDGDAYEKAVRVALSLQRPNTYVAPMRPGSDPEDGKEAKLAIERKERVS